MADDYTSADTLAEWLGFSSSEVSEGDEHLARAVTSASRAVDHYTARRFDQATEARTFQPCRYDRVDVDDIASLAGLVVKTDSGNTGTYGTTLTIDTDFIVEPVDALTNGRPIRRLTLLTGSLPVGGPRYRLQVTATFGWPEVPEDVVQATLIKAARIYRRRKTPDGIAGVNDFGPVRVSRFEDPDVVALLDPYRLGGGVMVA